MTPQETQLWQNIRCFELDDPKVTFKFSDRLARDNGWSISYTHRVIHEYKKFIFLCCITKEGVTPSDAVDQAWHLHLTFTKSYWIDLCQNTLQRQIHHNPTKGGGNEAAKFNGFYTSSHQLYTDKFGMAPPADIWPDNETRFSDTNFKRININRNWIIPKPSISVKSITYAMLVIVSTISIQASAAMIFPIVIMGIIAIAALTTNPDKEKERKNNGSGCGGGEGGCNHESGCNSHHGGHHGDGDSGCNSGGDSGCSSGCSGCGGGD